MPERTLVLFDDAVARDFRPFTLTRPAGELIFGAFLQRHRAERVLGLRCVGHLAAPHLAEFDEPGAVRVLAPPVLAADAAVLYLSSRAVPAWDAELPSQSPAVLTIGGEPCGWLVPPGSQPTPEFLEDPANAAPGDVATHELGGRLLRNVWELVSLSEEQLGIDIRAIAPPARAPAPPAGVHVVGDEPLVVGRNVRIDPHVVLDTRHGPIWLDNGSVVQAFSQLCGPSWVGPGSVVLGGQVEGAAIGPVCKVHGQVEASVFLGYTNKAHEGFIGHAYLGRWVNLGAMTTNSDLKNNYRPVDIWTPGGMRDTGEIKMGCFVGDHVKTGIGMLINTGTVIGAGSMLYGAALAPKHVPAFSWGTGEELVAYDLEKFLAGAAAAMGRRGIALTGSERAQLATAWKLERGEV